MWSRPARWKSAASVLAARRHLFKKTTRPRDVVPQSEKRRVVERFTIVDPETLRYEMRVEDEETYAAPWTVSFNYKRDDAYQQYEYACHEGNHSVPNSLSGARAEERD